MALVAERLDAHPLYRDAPRFVEAVRGRYWQGARLPCRGLKEPGTSASGFGPTRAAPPSGRDEALAKWGKEARDESERRLRSVPVGDYAASDPRPALVPSARGEVSHR